MRFNPCKGRDFCSSEGTHCSGCGRSHEEIAKTRELIDAIVDHAVAMGYENVDDFTAFVGQVAAIKSKGAMQAAAGGIGGFQIK